MTVNWTQLLILTLILSPNLIGVEVSGTADGFEVRVHPTYKDLKCYHRRITSMTRLRDDTYFISSSGQKYWLISEIQSADEKNSRDLKDIANGWDKVDASIYYGLDVECGRALKDRLILLNFNDRTNRNELIFGSLDTWNWTTIVWDEFDVFKLVRDRFDWSRSIDDMAIIEESIFIFQGIIANGKWGYEVSREYREVPLNGPFDAVYFGEAHKDTYPVYVVQEDRYSICFLKANNEEFAVCEHFELSQNSLAPKAKCFVVRDPNRALRASLTAQMILLFCLVVVMIVFGSLYIWHIWRFDYNIDSKIVTNERKDSDADKRKTDTSDDKDVTPRSPPEKKAMDTSATQVADQTKKTSNDNDIEDQVKDREKENTERE